ncbi:inositol hexakisphosphate kinase 3-like [Diadema antillarum]|uniref:inositol hexakisphosphate kinase 3-like n=1 Tax=Diadema antillarum TaxID=105358 RepID=UPI003A8379A1
MTSLPCKGLPLVPFIHQVGGHHGILLYDKETICKPLFQREVENYRHFSPVLGKYIPKFKGVIDVVIEKDNEGHVTYQAVSEPSCGGDERGGAPPSAIQLEPTSELECPRKQQDSVQSNGRPEDPSCQDGCEVKTNKYSTSPTCRRIHSLPELSSLRDGHQENLSSHDLFNDETEFSVRPQGQSLNPWSLHCHERQYLRHTLGDNKPSKIHSKYILLENISAYFHCPSILDLKIGTRCYGDDLSEEKKQQNIARATESTTRTLGVRFGGMQVYHADKGSYMCCNKKYGNTLTEESLREEIGRFIYQRHSHCGEIRQAMVDRITELRDRVLQLDQYRFFGCSVLMIYEGMDAASNGDRDGDGDGRNGCRGRSWNEEDAPNIVVKIIDFGHASSWELQASEGMDYQGVDASFVFGLDSLLQMLQASPNKE